jgi:hypothetical protein
MLAQAKPRHVNKAISTAEMIPDAWVHVPDNPRQRDHEQRASNARRVAHLLEPNITHAEVHAARLPNGQLIKLDGHTRAHLWGAGSVTKPGSLLVVIYDVEDVAEAEDLYACFDNRKAVETLADEVQGGHRKHDFHPQSTQLKAGHIATSLRMATCALRGRVFHPSTVRDDMPSLVGLWVDELHWCDDILLAPRKRNKVNQGLMAAMLMSARRYGTGQVSEFWGRYLADAGVKTPEGMDGVQMLARLMDQMSAARRTVGNAAAEEIASKALSCVDFYRRGEIVTKVYGVSLTKYFPASMRPE